MTRELTTDVLVLQAEAFIAYKSRGGPLSLEDWMEGKDFTQEDRQAMAVVLALAAVRGLRRVAS